MPQGVGVQVPIPAPRRKDPLPLRFPLSRQTAQDGVLSPFSAATRCAGLAAEEETGSNLDCSGAPKEMTGPKTGHFFWSPARRAGRLRAWFAAPGKSLLIFSKTVDIGLPADYTEMGGRVPAFL